MSLSRQNKIGDNNNLPYDLFGKQNEGEKKNKKGELNCVDFQKILSVLH